MLVMVALALIFFGKYPHLLPLSEEQIAKFGGPIDSDGVRNVKGIIGSEKQPYFDDPAVQKRLEELGFKVSVTTAGSREMAQSEDLNRVDFLFPSSAPAADNLAMRLGSAEKIEPFYSPMAIATFAPVVDVLEREGIVHYDGERPIMDVKAYVNLAEEGKRWNELGPEVPSPRPVLITSTDIRKSNSAAMYLSLLTWSLAEEKPEITNYPSMMAKDLLPFFSGQGYTQSSSAGPFADYLGKGIGAAPMVMIYEAQYVEEAMAEHSRLGPENRLVYPSPTVVASHTVVARTDKGKDLGHALAEDPQLQELAARHGFRPSHSGDLAQVASEHGLVVPENIMDTVPPPTYNVLDRLITEVGSAYGN